MSAEQLEIHIIADSTGESAVRIARAAITQFPGQDFRFVRHRRMTSKETLSQVLEQLQERAAHPTIVMYTLVKHDYVEMVQATCRDLNIPNVDLMTEAIAALEKVTGASADAVARRPVGVEADYFTRVSAIDFAVRNDDGAAPGALHEADIVLVGASRSGKTPLSMYLGYLGYKTANVPLVPSIPPPPELFNVDRWRIVGLTMDAERLQLIRTQRVRTMGGFGTRDGYAELAQIYDELDEVAQVHRKLTCPIIDTTGVALEELASRILDMVVNRAAKHGASLRRLPGVVCPTPPEAMSAAP